MPGQPTTAGAVKMLDGLNGRVTQNAGTTYLALFITAPDDTGAGTEITTAGTNGYSRQAVTWGAPSGDPSVAANTNLITFGAFSSNLPEVPHLALMSAATGGTMLYYWTADAPKDPDNGDSITVDIGALTMSAD
jgi:hypothetical protein